MRSRFKRYATSRAYLLFVLLLTPPGVGAQENLRFLPPPEWEPGNTRQTRDELLMEFVKKGEKIDNWTELLTMQQFRRTRGPSSLREFYESAKQVREKRCPGLTEWTIVEEAEATQLYEWKMTGV